ncbi:MAG TPA: alpha/beta fold hydrolase [Gemmataceae bacterium]|nr:alpha/beta fold hydrolase [Gemmataceae bacterium]
MSIVSPLDFRPLPLLRNPHVQTILGTCLRGPAFKHATVERELLLADGDRLLLFDSVPPGWQPGQPIALLLHGLGGSHQSYHLQRMGRHLLPLGYRVVRLDMRGCGKGAPLARRFYHAGLSADIREVAQEIGRWAPTSPLTVIGFSLGGNIALKMAGELPDAPVPNLSRVAALAPPIDLVGSCAKLAQPWNRLYDRHFVRELIRLARHRQLLFPDSPPMDFPRRMTMRLFDDLYTAPRSGFADALDYYQRSSSFPLIPRIPVPTLILTSRDDPFISVEPFDRLKVPSHIEIRILKHGGHLGFLGWDGAGGIRWAERRIVDWLS